MERSGDWERREPSFEEKRRFPPPNDVHSQYTLLAGRGTPYRRIKRLTHSQRVVPCWEKCAEAAGQKLVGEQQGTRQTEFSNSHTHFGIQRNPEKAEKRGRERVWRTEQGTEE